MKAYVFNLETKEASEKEVSPTEAFGSTTPAEVLAIEIKRHTSERIRRVVKDEITSQNITAFAVKLARMEANGTLSDVDKSFLDAIDALQTWTMATLACGRALAKAEDYTYADDAHWPTPPTGVEALVRAL